MGLYNAIFGVNPNAGKILEALGLLPGQIGRFRDAFIIGGEIAVYTRMGGPNREEYREQIEALRSHPCYLRDEDDDFDSTYATFYFRIPHGFELSG